MRSTPYWLASERTAEILRESAIVCKAIARQEENAASDGRAEEAHKMEVLCIGVSRMVLSLVERNQQADVA
jgi:hypothetical protein